MYWEIMALEQRILGQKKNRSHVRLDALTVQTKVLDLYFDDEPGAQFGRVAASVGNGVQNKIPLHARTAQGGKLK